LANERVLRFFTAPWDGSAPGYRDVVGRVAEVLEVRVVDVDVDDAVGGGMARLFGVMSTPCVIDVADRTRRLIGARSQEELAAAFGSLPEATN
jgi:hypothetical protein